MNCTAFYVLGILATISVTVINSKDFCGKRFRNGKWESYGDCDDSTKSNILQELDAKIVPACYMGLKSRTIPDSAITASSFHPGTLPGTLENQDVEPHRARLDNQVSATTIGTWCVGQSYLSLDKLKTQWIQVDFDSKVEISGVVTQGDPRPAKDQYVTSYKVSCDGSIVTENGSDKVFTGNNDIDSKVYNRFPQILKCQHVKIHPQSYHNYPCLRMEFVRGDCFEIFNL